MPDARHTQPSTTTVSGQRTTGTSRRAAVASRHYDSTESAARTRHHHSVTAANESAEAARSNLAALTIIRGLLIAATIATGLAGLASLTSGTLAVIDNLVLTGAPAVAAVGTCWMLHGWRTTANRRTLATAAANGLTANAHLETNTPPCAIHRPPAIPSTPADTMTNPQVTQHPSPKAANR